MTEYIVGPWSWEMEQDSDYRQLSGMAREGLTTNLVWWQGFPVDKTVKNLHAMRDTQVQSLGGEDPLEKEVATHSSILAWKIPRTEEAGG